MNTRNPEEHAAYITMASSLFFMERPMRSKSSGLLPCGAQALVKVFLKLLDVWLALEVAEIDVVLNKVSTILLHH